MKNLSCLLSFVLLMFFSTSVSAQNTENNSVDSVLLEHFGTWKKHLLNREFTQYYTYQGYEFFIRAKVRLPNAGSSANDLDAMLNGLNIKSVNFKVISPLYQSDNAEYYTGYEVLELVDGVHGAGEFESPILYIRAPQANTWKFIYLNEVTRKHIKKVIPNAPADFIIPKEKDVVLSDQSY